MILWILLLSHDHSNPTWLVIERSNVVGKEDLTLNETKWKEKEKNVEKGENRHYLLITTVEPKCQLYWWPLDGGMAAQ